MFILIGNYDSFTYNLFHYIGEEGADVEVFRNDQISAHDVLNLAPEGIILSPGPCDPDQAGICLELVDVAAGKVPLMGVCLGHQTIGQAFGGEVIRAPIPKHGKVDQVLQTDGNGRLFKDLPSRFTATRYHSLVVDRNTLPDCLNVTAETKDGCIMGLEHKDLPIYGLQFHPESIQSEFGHRMLRNFIDAARESGTNTN